MKTVSINTKKILKKADWWEFYKVITDTVPEFKLDEYDVHVNGEWEARCRYLNKYKYDKVQEFMKTAKKRGGASMASMFILKLDLAKAIHDYDNRGKKTMQEAIDYIKNHE